MKFIDLSVYFQVMETYSIINIDDDGSASKITSYQKNLVIENQDSNEIPDTVCAQGLFCPHT